MRKEFVSRLESLERQGIEKQKAAQRECFLSLAWPMVLAYLVGGLKPKECLWEGFARSLKYRDGNGFFKAFTRAMKTGDAAELRTRQDDAARRLFAGFSYDRSSPEKLDEAITKIAERLPDERKEWITKVTEKVDYYEDLKVEAWAEQFVRAFEQGKNPPKWKRSA